MNIGHVLRRIRKEKNASLEEIALSAGTDAANLSRVERDKQRLTPDMLEKVAKALDVPVSSLYLIAEQNTREQDNTQELIDRSTAARLENCIGKFMLLSGNDQQLVIDFMDLLRQSSRQ